MAYTTIDDPSAYFHTQLFTGTGSELSVTNDANAGDFKPDWIWIKNRAISASHVLTDTTRGATKSLFSDQNAGDTTEAQQLKSFNTDGFTVGTSNNVNGSSNGSVAWQWKANGGTTSSNSDGSITSTVQANTTSGFSIITYTGTGSNATIGHGLGSAPTMVIVKNRSSAEHWMVGHHKNSNGFQSSVFLNLTSAKDTDAVYFNNTAPTSTVISIGTNDKINHSSENHVMYAFAEKQGYSKFGSYTGVSNDDGTFVYTGFAPAWVMIKRTDTAKNWYIFDNKRPGYNVINRLIAPNLNSAEVDGSEKIDLLSNGFKLRQSFTHTNTDGGTFIYMAFAESPFVSSEGVPTTAR